MNKEILKSILITEDIDKSIGDNKDLLFKLIPELIPCVGFLQNHPHHHLDVWLHTLLALSKSPNNFTIRVVLLLHDIGKPYSYQEGSDGVRHFKGHSIVSSKIAFDILKRLEFSDEETDYLCKLIKNHDTKIDLNKIKDNYEYYKTLYQVQECDCLAHNPLYLEKRIKYLNTLKPYFNILKVEYLENIYKETKEIDKIFEVFYDIRSKEIIDKYILELLVEIGELANETKCFKFWSNKTPNESLILEEYIDCLFMVLYFCNIMSIDLNEKYKSIYENDIIRVFISLYYNTSILLDDLEKEQIKYILSLLLKLGEILNFNISDLEKETILKKEKIIKRFNDNEYRR